MRFRPCIDIHNGKVKQIVGGSLRDQGDMACENYVSEQDAAFYASLYRQEGLRGGHIILLNSVDSPYYEATRQQALLGLKEYPGGLQVGGGITPENASFFLDAGASHVIVTSYVFRDGRISYENLEKMVRAVGREHLVLDLSCRKRNGKYYVVTDRWQNFTDVEVTPELMEELGGSCDEFLIHGVDVEGKAKGIEEELAAILSVCTACPVTYAGGVGSLPDVERLRICGKGHLDVTIGSALDLFGGPIPFREVLRRMDQEKMSVNGKEYEVIKLLGKGKGGYSYLVAREGKQYVLKQIHHEPCDYYEFGDKLASELRDYERLRSIGIPMPRLLEADTEQERILKEYIEGETIYELVKSGQMKEDYFQQIEDMCSRLYPANTNIDYFPTNFVVQEGKLQYIDYECNDYMEQWDFANWGIKYWSKTPEFLQYVKDHE